VISDINHVRKLFLLLPLLASAQTPLVVISVDGLDHRYLRDADKLGLKVPHMRRLMKEGEMASGVVGVLSTVTWPSHTSLITGKRPDEHGIRGNRRPREEGGDYYWSVSLLKAPTLWQAAEKAGMKTAAITWPVTVDAGISYNLPEAFAKRQGGWMDLASIAAKGTPGLVDKITAFDKSFQQEWMDDRTRAIATVYMLKKTDAKLILLHFVDHDAVAHDHGPFTKESLAELERTDTYIGQIVAAAPKSATICLTADHGFERIDRMINVASLNVQSLSGVVIARTPEEAARLKNAPAEFAIGREIPRAELSRFVPFITNAVTAYEPVEHAQFTRDLANTAITLPPHERGNHGQWPARADYRSTFILRGLGIKAGKTPEIDMLSIAGRLARVLGVSLN
jgi:predicted AlkP superfamily pyrophosphatase or phosphodiesterase